MPCQTKSRNQGWAIGISQEWACQRRVVLMQDKADWHKKVLLTEFDQKRSLDMCGAGAAHDCDSEEGRALQDIFFSSLLIVILV